MFRRVQRNSTIHGGTVSVAESETLATTFEVAQMFRCSARKVLTEARRISVGANLGGRAGYRFTAADIEALRESMRPAAPVERRRRRAS